MDSYTGVRTPRWRLGRTLFFLSSVVSGAIGCSTDTAITLSPPPATQAYWALRLNQRAVNMALTEPFDTLQLTAIPLSAAGTPLTGAGPVTFRGSDSTVTVSPSGLITAHYVTPLTRVIASLQVHGVTLVDTALVQVTRIAPLHPLASFSMQPASGDSAKWTIDSSTITWSVTAKDIDSTTICSNSVGCPLLVAYTTSDPSIAVNADPINQPGVFVLESVGHVILSAQTWAYGVARRDSVNFTVGLGIGYTTSITSTTLVGGGVGVAFSAKPRLILAVGSIVTFLNKTANPVDVVFDDTTGIDTASFTDIYTGNINPPTGRGNIAPFGGDTVCDTTIIQPVQACAFEKFYILDPDYSARTFTVPGVYRYHSRLYPSDTFSIDIEKEH